MCKVSPNASYVRNTSEEEFGSYLYLLCEAFTSTAAPPCSAPGLSLLFKELLIHSWALFHGLSLVFSASGGSARLCCSKAVWIEPGPDTVRKCSAAVPLSHLSRSTLLTFRLHCELSTEFRFTFPVLFESVEPLEVPWSPFPTFVPLLSNNPPNNDVRLPAVAIFCAEF